MMRVAVLASPINGLSRFRISAAALLVKVTAQIRGAGILWWCTRCATRHVKTRVLPEPGPAKI